MNEKVTKANEGIKHVCDVRHEVLKEGEHNYAVFWTRGGGNNGTMLVTATSALKAGTSVWSCDFVLHTVIQMADGTSATQYGEAQ
jgi:hypothetical protein